MLTFQILQKSTISTKDVRYACLNTKNFYLGTLMEEYEYMRMPMRMFPAHTIQQ